jgi:hypothetical protein
MTRRVRVPLLALLGAVSVAAFALAQELVPIKISAVTTVTPNKAGTPKHPQGVVIETRAKIDIPADYEPPVTKTVDVWFPRGGVYNGGKFPVCDLRRLQERGVAGCPKSSIMGHGDGVAAADTVASYPRITVINGGARHVYFYTVLKVPARVAQPVVATITKLRGGPYGYRLHADIPRNLQIVAGIPLRLQKLHFKVGRKDWIASTHCPASHRWKYHVEARFDSGQLVKYDGSVACRS